jgi:hypothetical protein
MKTKILLLTCLLYFQPVFGQVAEFQTEFNRINKKLMVGLGSYAMSNFVFSGIGYSTAKTEQTERFHEMNVIWNTVNMSLAVSGYLNAARGGKAMNREEMIKMQKKTETIFIVNSCLDIGYMSAGLWMRSLAPNRRNQEELFRGYGNSLILQGSFLLVFDSFAYLVHHQHSRKLPLLDKITLNTSGHGIGIRLQLD